MAGNGKIPKFGEWKTTDGAQPYTMYFETASRKRKTNSGITPPPPPAGASSPAPMDTNPAAHRTPPRTAADAKPVKSTDRANRSRNQDKAGRGSVPTWGQWNENNGGGAQQYTVAFDQLKKERRAAPPTPNMERPQPAATPTRRATRQQDLYDKVPKGFTCWGLFGK